MNLFDPRDQFDDWFASPPVHVDAVFRRWVSIVAREAPWEAMPRDDVSGAMRSILSELLNEARDLDDDARRARLAAAARRHGAFRQAQRCTDEQLGLEFALALAAIGGAMRRVGVDVFVVDETIAALDVELQAATGAALRAWRRCALRGPSSAPWFERLLQELN